MLNSISDRLSILESKIGEMSADRMVGIKRACELLGKTEGAVRQMVYRGDINCTHRGRKLVFSEKYLKQYYN